MHAVPPFMAAQFITAVALGTAVGAFAGWQMALLGAGAIGGGTAISIVISAMIWPTQHVSGWKLALVAMLANPTMLLALLATGIGWQCAIGRMHDFGCIASFAGALVVIICLLSVCAGLLWRWWKGRTDVMKT